MTLPKNPLAQLPGAPIYWLEDGTPVYIGSKQSINPKAWRNKE